VAFQTLAKDKNFKEAITQDPSIGSNLNMNELRNIFDPNNHLAASTKIIDNVAKKVKVIRRNHKLH
jgi:adenylosuccinate lyase